MFGRDIHVIVNKTYNAEYRLEKIRLTQDEIIDAALNKMTDAINGRLKDASLIRISSSGNFQDSAYTMRTDMVYSRQIGENVPFSVQNS